MDNFDHEIGEVDILQPNLLQITQCLSDLIFDVEKAKSFGVSQIDSLQSKLDICDSELQESKCALSQASQDCSQLEENLIVTKAQLQNALSERDDRTKEKEELRKQLSDLKSQVELKGTALENALSERDDRTKEKEELQKQLSDLMKKLESSEVSLQQKKVEATNYSEEAKDTLVRLQQAQEELERYFNLHEILQQKLIDLGLQLDAKNNELVSVVSGRDLIAMEKSKLQKEFSDLMKELKSTQASLRLKESEAKVNSEKVKDTFLRLQDAQEGLEKYFALSKYQEDLLGSYSRLIEKSSDLISSHLTKSDVKSLLKSQSSLLSASSMTGD